MANITFESEVTWSGKGVMSMASTGGKQFIIDEPISLGGTDKGPNPVEYLLGALGGCINVLVMSFAPLHNVEVLNLAVHVEGDLDPDGFLGKNPDVRVGYQEIRYEIDIDSPSPAENIAALIEHVEKACPVKDSLSGVPTKRITR